MMPFISKRWFSASLAWVLLTPHSVMQAQSFPSQRSMQDRQDPLEDLVAPVALYPDPLLSQVLAAATYPLEIVEAQQWLQGNRNLQGQRLIEAAKQQNWDPSVQLLVAFPDVLALCSRDVRWTTSLGNAFLTQQADVMDAIQRLRARATQNGRLATTPQQIVSTETEDNQSAIQIQPADPQVIYPPLYNPSEVWDSSAPGDYRNSAYSQGGYQSGSRFGSGANLGGLFSGLLGGAGSLENSLGGGLLGGLGGWGWILNWFTHSLSLNDLFFNGLGFNNSGGGYRSNGGFNGASVWAHDPVHRRGIPYANGFRAAGYRGADLNAGSGYRRFSGASFRSPGFADSGRGRAGNWASEGWHRFEGGGTGSSPFSSAGARGFQRPNRMMGSYDRGGEPYRSGFASNGGRPEDFRRSSAAASPQTASNFRNANPFGRSMERPSRFEAPRTSSQHFSFKPLRSEPHFSAPRFSSSHSSAPRGSPHFSQPHRSSGGGHSGKSRHKH